jgi:opacity protein-like surface antigen
MKKIIILLIASVLGFGVAAHAADANTKESAQQVQVKKLRAQAAKQHKKADALTAKADKLESELAANPGEKMRGGYSAALGRNTNLGDSTSAATPLERSEWNRISSEYRAAQAAKPSQASKGISK